VNEYVARKQCQFDFFATVLPLMRCPVKRDKTTQTAEFHLSGNTFLMACAGVNRVPLGPCVFVRDRRNGVPECSYSIHDHCRQLRHLTYKDDSLTTLVIACT